MFERIGIKNKIHLFIVYMKHTSPSKTHEILGESMEKETPRNAIN